jgi:hypothetical protein
MVDWTDDKIFEQMPSACRRALASFTGPDRSAAMTYAWDHCPDAISLLWLAAVRAPHKEGGDRKVLEEIERAKARVLEHINDPASDPARRGEDRLVVHIEQPLAILKGKKATDRLEEWDKDLDGPMPREQWIEYARRMDFIVEGIRINLRDIVVD